MENLRQSKEMDYEGVYYLPLTLSEFIGEGKKELMLYFNRNKKYIPAPGRRFSNIRFKMKSFKETRSVKLSVESKEELRKIFYFDSPIPIKYSDADILYFLLEGYAKGKMNYKVILSDQNRGNLVLDYIAMTSIPDTLTTKASSVTRVDAYNEDIEEEIAYSYDLDEQLMW